MAKRRKKIYLRNCTNTPQASMNIIKALIVIALTSLYSFTSQSVSQNTLWAQESKSGSVKASAARNHDFDISSNMEIMYNIVRELDINYVDSINLKERIEDGIKAMLRGIDPYTTYYPESDQNDLKMMTTGKYAGVGAIISQFKGRDYVVVSEPYEGMPAQKAGIRAGDRIVRIDGESMKGKESAYVSSKLKGDPNTSLRVAVARPGVADTLEFDMTRQIISLPSVPYWGKHDDFGYIYLNSFTENCSKDVAQAFMELKGQGIKGLVLDLRGNGGGLLQEAVNIIGLFVPKGTKVLETRGKVPQMDASYSTRREPVDTEMPVVVMIDSESASASEIVSGALQDLDRAVIIGGRSFGKGLVQSTRPLPYNGVLKVTTAKYYIPSGRCIQEIDYSKRSSNGQAQHIPDSLTNVFHTAAGRPVRDGGGIRPDITCKFDTMPDIMYYLSQSMVMFDYMDEYCSKHETIAPVSEFTISDKEYAEFIDFVSKSDFQYTSNSSRALKSLREMAEMEGLAQKADAEFKALESKLEYDMKQDLDQFSYDIRRLLATEIITRYYYQKGAIIEGLKNDHILEEAVKVLKDSKRYTSILTNR